MIHFVAFREIAIVRRLRQGLITAIHSQHIGDVELLCMRKPNL